MDTLHIKEKEDNKHLTSSFTTNHPNAIEHSAHYGCTCFTHDRDVYIKKINAALMETSIPAARKIGRAQTTLLKSFWILVFIITFSGFLFHLSTIIVRFKEVPVSTQTTVMKIDKLPTVTICPQSYISGMRFNTINSIPHNHLQNITFDELYNDNIPVFWNLVYSTRGSTVDKKLVGQKIKNNLLWYANKHWKYLNTIEQQKQDIFLYLHQKNGNLTLSSVTTTLDSNQNKCFALIPESIKHEIGSLQMILNVPDGRYFYAEQDSFELVSDNGLWLNVCFNNHFGCYDNIRFFVKTGRYTKIDLRKSLVSQIATEGKNPQDSCMSSEHAFHIKTDLFNPDSDTIDVPYTSALCTDLKIQKEIYKTCNCLSLQLPTETSLYDIATKNGTEEHPFCSIPPKYVFLHKGFNKLCIKSTTDPRLNENCIVDLLHHQNHTTQTSFNKLMNNPMTILFLIKDICHDNVIKERTNFQCPKTCLRQQYSSVHSVVSWPESQLSRKFKSTFARIVVNTMEPFINNALTEVQQSDLDDSVLISLNKTFQDLINVNFNKSTSYNKGMDFLQERLALLEIGYASEDMQVLQESIAYPLKSFMSDIGGLIGLWVGMALVSICELLLLLGSGIRVACKKLLLAAGINKKTVTDNDA